MDFPDYDFQRLNEADIREEIIAPLLRNLGYQSGTKHNIVREQALSYPKLSLGRKKNSDPILRGKADYICEAHGKIRWVIEAKSPNSALDKDAEGQAWSYSNHPEIRAVYFCLSNGQEFKIYQTNRGPEEPPILECKYKDLKESLTAIKNTLSPEALLREYPDQKVDTGKPIGPGLRSIVRITNGFIKYDDYLLESPEKEQIKLQQLAELMITITTGSVERNENGKLEGYIETMVPFKSLQKFNEKLGLHSMRLTSDSETISCNPDEPTIFSSETEHIIPEGESIFDITTWKEILMPINMRVNNQTKAIGHLEKDKFHGEFKVILDSQAMKVQIVGQFNIHLA